MRASALARWPQALRSSAPQSKPPARGRWGRQCGVESVVASKGGHVAGFETERVFSVAGRMAARPRVLSFTNDWLWVYRLETLTIL